MSKPVVKGQQRRNRIVVKEWQEFKNSEGVYVKHWADMCKVWAYIKPLSGSEAFVGQATEKKETIKVNIRYNKLINDTMRIQIGEILYKIAYIEDVDFAHIEQWITLEKVI